VFILFSLFFGLAFRYFGCHYGFIFTWCQAFYGFCDFGCLFFMLRGGVKIMNEFKTKEFVWICDHRGLKHRVVGHGINLTEAFKALPNLQQQRCTMGLSRIEINGFKT